MPDERSEQVSPDPTPFLRARLNEDAKIARSVTDQQTVENLDAVLSIAQPDATPAGVRAIATHVVRWDPARVLAEVAAKRRIIELHSGMHECSTYDHNGEIDNCTWVIHACSTILLLTAPYADHPDYSPGWDVLT